MDMTVVDPEDGNPWDFNIKEKRDKAKEIIRSKKSLLLILSPMCTAFSSMQGKNGGTPKVIC